MSNYETVEPVEEVREAEPKTIRCNVCHGSGLVEVHGQETDCLECEGYGDLLVD